MASEAKKAAGLRIIEVDTLATMVLHGLNLDEVLEHLESALRQELEPGQVPLNPEELALLRTHGIDDEQYRAVNQQDGGAAYRALMARRAKKGAAA